MGRVGRGVRSKSESSIEITFQYEGQRCRETIPLPPTTANLKRVELHRANILYEISRGTFDYAQVFPNSKHVKSRALHIGDVETTGDFLESWIDSKTKQLAASTAREWRNTVEHLLIPKFGKTPIGKLIRRDIRAWLESLDVGRKKPMSNKRLANIQTVFRCALDDATEDEVIEANPLAGYTYSRNMPFDPFAEDAVDPFSIEEQRLILAACDTPDYRNFVQFALWTGLRTSELVALDWNDIDWVRGVVRVRKAMTKDARGVAETTKTPAGRREVKLLPPALAALTAQKELTYLAGENIFQSPKVKKRWSGDKAIWDIWQTTIKRARVRYRVPYQTRHTYASMMLSAGEHPMWVAKQMGHADWTMIARVYGKWMPDADTGAGSRAVAMFSNNSNAQTNDKSSQLS
jgi:integrase